MTRKISKHDEHEQDDAVLPHALIKSVAPQEKTKSHRDERHQHVNAVLQKVPYPQFKQSGAPHNGRAKAESSETENNGEAENLVQWANRGDHIA